MKKKIFSMLLVLAMVLSMVPSALAADFVPQDVNVSKGNHFRELKVTNIEKQLDNSLKVTLTFVMNGNETNYYLGETTAMKDEFGEEASLGSFSEIELDFDYASAVAAKGNTIEFVVPHADYKDNGVGITLVIATDVVTDMLYYDFSLDSNGDFLVPAGAATAAITAPANEGSVQGVTGITATITPDGTNAVTHVRYLIQSAAGKYLSAADGTFGDTETWIEETFAAAADGGAQTWTSATISATFASGDHTLKVQAKDAAGYGMAATANFSVDNTKPSITAISRKASADELTNKANGLEFAVTYSEPVKGVVAADFTASGGTVGTPVSNNGTPTMDANWTITVTGYTDGEVSLTEASTSATTDVAGNALEVNTTKKTASYTYDGTAPAIEKVTANSKEIQGGSASDVAPSGAMTITLTETNKKTSGAISGIALDNSGTVSNAKYNADGTITFDYSGLPANTSVTLTVPVTAVVDAAGNQMAAEATYAFTTANLGPNDLAAGSDKSTSALTYGDTFTVTATGGNSEAITFTPSNNLTKTANTATTATYKVNDHTGTATVSVSQPASATASGATLTNVVNATLSQREVTVDATGITKPSKAYDGTATAAITGALTLGNTVQGDTVSLTGTLAGTYATTDASDTINVTLSGYSLDGTDKEHYSLPTAAPVVTGEITKAELTSNMLSWNNVSFSDVAYDNGTAIAAGKVTGAPTATGVTFDTVTYTRANKNVGATVAVNAAITAITATNYKLPANGLTVNGIGKTVNVTSVAVTYTYTGEAIAKVYDSTAAVSAADKAKLEAVAVTGRLGEDEVSIDASAAVYASVNVADGISITGLALKGSDKDNYTLTAPTVTGNITGLAETAPTIVLSGATKNSFTATVTSGAKYYVSESATPSATLTDYTQTGDGAEQIISGKAPTTKYYVHAYTPASDGNHLASAKATESITTAEAGKVNVNFHGNGNNGGEMTMQQIAENGTANLTANAFTKTGFAFKGWATSQSDADAGTVAYADSASITVVETAVELYAVWTANVLTGVKPVAVAATKDVAYTLAAPTFTGEDAVDATAVNPAVTYALTGGSAALTEYGLSFSTTTGVITGTPGKAGTITGVTATITGRNGATTAAIAYDDIEVKELPVLTVTAVADSVSAYAGDTLAVSQFIKTVTGLENDDSISSLFTGNAAQDSAVSRVKVTFYESADSGATWTKMTGLPTVAGTYWYTVSVEADGAFHDSYALAVLNSTSDPTDGTPTKDGVLTLSNRPSGGGGSVTYRLTFETNGGSKISAINKSRNTEIELTQTPTKEGFVFDGWYLDKGLTEKVASVKLTKNMTVYAKWIEEKKPESPEGLGFDKEMTKGYIEGVKESGTDQVMFKPEAAMTRGEVAAILARTLVNKMEPGKTYDLSKYSDVNSDAWYANYIGFLTEMGVITGFGDGTCRPEQMISRAEFVAMVIRIDGITAGENHFTDVNPNHWAEQYIVAAAAKGYVDGYGDGTFGPAKEIGRAEAVKIMNAILGWTGQTEAANPFSDVTESHWAYNEIVKAAIGK